MCGILGAVPSVEKVKFQNVLRSLAHRGPDGEGVWQDDEYAILGHRRLAILDLSSMAAQPMQFLGRYNIVFNGEIYNFLEIKRELEMVGYQFVSSSDTEVLVAAFAEWGANCLKRLNGMWAFAIWDSVEKLLFLSRDRMGEKPLYYFHNGCQFAFASEQKALLPYLDRVQPSNKFDLLCKNSYAYEATDECLFEGIKRFPAAHYAWLSGEKFTKHCYWSTLESDFVPPLDYQGQVECLRELLLDACRIRMRADVPIGTGLSGGVDSSAVAANISEVAKRSGLERVSANWQNSFVASFPGTVMDESAYAIQVAEHLGIKHTKVEINPSKYISQLEKQVYLFEDIHEVNPIPHIALYSAMRNNGIIVTLDGHGGDELFCGYESSPLHALPDAIWNRQAVKNILETYKDLHPQNEYFRGMSLSQIAWYLFKAKVRMIRDEGFITENKLKKHFGGLNAHLFELSFRTVLPTLLRNYDRYSMMSSVEIRMPLIDHRIVEFAFLIPWSSKVKNGFTKAVLRDAVGAWLPVGIINRKDKIGFAPPIQDWIRGPLREYLLDEIESRSFIEADMIAPKRLGSAIRDIIYGNNKMTLYEAEQTWKKFNIYLWEKAFIQKQLWKIKD